MAINTAGQTLTSPVAPSTSQFACGKVVFDATAITAADYVQITCGFKPRRIVWIEYTTGLNYEWQEGMVDDTCVKTIVNGTRSIETTNKGLTATATGFQVSQNATLIAITASKTCYWQAYA